MIYCTDEEGPTDITALMVGYDNTSSGLSATSTQGAIDELKSDLPKIQFGNVTTGTIQPQTSATINVTFDEPFDVAPHVFLTNTSNYPNTGISISGVTTTGFTLYVYNADTTTPYAINVNYMAIV